MILAKTTDLWGLMVPYIKKECAALLDNYIKERVSDYEKELRGVLEPQLETLSVEILRMTKDFGTGTEVRLVINGLKNEERGK